MKQQQVIPSAKRIFLFFVFCIITGSLAYVFISGIESAIDPVSLLPKNTALLIDLKKPAVSITRFRRSRLGRQIASIQWQDVLQEIGMPDEDIQNFLKRTGEFETAIKSPLFSELVGKRLLLGLIPVPVTEESRADKANPEHMMVFIARPRHKASLVDFLSSYFANDFEYTKQPYKGRIIKTYVFDNNISLSASVTDGLVIASFFPEVVKRCIDISINNMTTGQSGLQGNRTYDQLKKRAKGSDDLFVYADIRNLRNVISRPIGASDYFQRTAVRDNFLPDEFPVRCFAFFRQPRKSLFRYSSIIQYNSDIVLPRNSFLQNYRPDKDTVLAGLPDDILAHLWTNVFDVDELWRFLRNRPNHVIQPYVHNFETWLLENTTLSVKDFLSLFGRHSSLEVTGIRSSEFFPMPKVCLRLEVNDRETVRHLLEQLFTGLHVQQSIISNKKVFSVMLAGGLIQPSYLFSDGFLVIADSPRQLEKILSQDRKPLLKTSRFNKVDVGLAENNNLVIYYRNAELIDGVKELLLWYSSLLPFYDSNSGRKNKVIVEKIVLPVLEGMKMYKVKSARVYSTDTELIIKSAQLLKDDDE